MRKSEVESEELFEPSFTDSEGDIDDEKLIKSDRDGDARRGIEDYFERKKLKSLDDWYKDL